MARFFSDALRIMRLAIARRNATDPDSSDATLSTYLNDFIELSMSDDVHVFENWGTLQFGIVADQDIYTAEEVGFTENFVNTTMEAFITDPDNEFSTNWLSVYIDPGVFYGYWNIFDTSKLIPGMPTDMLFYDSEFVFRTIPNKDYTIRIYSYKRSKFIVDEEASPGNPRIPFDYWLRYLAYGAAMDYARDYKFDAQDRQTIQQDFNHYKKLLLTRTHNQIKYSRGSPSV